MWLGTVLLSAAAGCGGWGPGAELSGEAMLARFPQELRDAIPPDAILCLHESRGGPEGQNLWILRAEGPRRVGTPGSAEDRQEGVTSTETVARLLAEKTPWLDVPPSAGGRAAYAQWSRDGRDFRVRELATERGWYAAIEQFGGP
jgi:hypothetical protein